jgi:hypothetical protein
VRFNKGTCTLHIITAVFIIAKIRKQPKCPTANVELYIMEFYLASKKKEILSFTGTWMELEIIIK